MARRSSYTPNRSRDAEYNAVVDKALEAAARIVTTDVILRFKSRRWGYTSGAFVHRYAGVAQSITQSAAHEHPTIAGRRRVVIGTNKRSEDGFSYPTAWEFGHHNIFTRKFERVETFRPALDENRDRVRAAFERVRERFRKGGTDG